MADLPPGFVRKNQQSATPEPPPGFVLKEEVEAGDAPGRGFVRTIDDITRSIASGMSFGLGDEFAAGMGALTGFPEAPEGQGDYGGRLAAERARMEEIPLGTRLPAEIAGGVATGLAAAPAVAGTAVARGFSHLLKKYIASLPGWARAAGFGGLFGGAYGFGTSEGGPAERAKGTAVGAAGGAALGPPLHYAGQAIGAGGRRIAQEWRRAHSPEAAARRALTQAMETDRVTPELAASRLNRRPDSMIADAAGPNVRGLARAVATTPGPGKARAETMLNRRAAAEEGAIEDATRRLSDENMFAAEEAFLRGMREEAAPLYRQAYEQFQSITTPALERILDSKLGRRALRASAEIIENERAAGTVKYMGAIDREITGAMRAEARRAAAHPVHGQSVAAGMAAVPKPGAIRGLSLEAWDHVKRGFDAVLDSPKMRDPVTKKLTQLGHSVDQMRRRVLSELDTATGGPDSIYARARAAYGGQREALGALTEGRGALKMPAEVIARRLDELSASGRQAFRTGYARAIMDSVNEVQRTAASTASLARRVIGSTNQRRRLRAVFADPADYRAFVHELSLRMLYHDTRSAVVANSRTAPVLAEQSALQAGAGNVGALAGAMASGGGGQMIIAGMRSRFGRRIAAGLVGRDHPRYHQELGRMLFSTNQAENRAVLAHVRQAYVTPEEQAGVLADIMAAGAGIGWAQTEQRLNFFAGGP